MGPSAFVIAAFAIFLLPAAAELVAAPPKTVDLRNSQNAPGTNTDDTPESLHTIDKLRAIILPKVDFEDWDIYQVVEYLNKQSKAHDPEHAGIQFAFGLPYGCKFTISSPRNAISASFRNVRLSELLEDICADDGLRWCVFQGRIGLGPCGTETGIDNSKPADIKARKNVARRLRWIIIPKIDFTDATIADVVDFLNKQVRLLDPNHIGVKFALNLPATGPPNRFPIRHKVTIQARNKSALELLGELVDRANLNITCCTHWNYHPAVCSRRGVTFSRIRPQFR